MFLVPGASQASANTIPPCSQRHCRSKPIRLPDHYCYELLNDGPERIRRKTCVRYAHGVSLLPHTSDVEFRCISPSAGSRPVCFVFCSCFMDCCFLFLSLFFLPAL